MKKFPTFLLGMILGAGMMFVSLKYHVVRAQDGFHMISKGTADFRQIYVDIRNFGFEEWGKNQELAVAIGASNKGYLLGDSALQSVRDYGRDAFDNYLNR